MSEISEIHELTPCVNQRLYGAATRPRRGWYDAGRLPRYGIGWNNAPDPARVDALASQLVSEWFLALREKVKGLRSTDYIQGWSEGEMVVEVGGLLAERKQERSAKLGTCDSYCSDVRRAEGELRGTALLGTRFLCLDVGRDETVIRTDIRDHDNEDRRQDQHWC